MSGSVRLQVWLVPVKFALSTVLYFSSSQMNAVPEPAWLAPVCPAGQVTGRETFTPRVTLVCGAHAPPSNAPPPDPLDPPGPLDDPPASCPPVDPEDPPDAPDELAPLEPPVLPDPVEPLEPLELAAPPELPPPDGTCESLDPQCADEATTPTVQQARTRPTCERCIMMTRLLLSNAPSRDRPRKLAFRDYTRAPSEGHTAAGPRVPDTFAWCTPGDSGTRRR